MKLSSWATAASALAVCAQQSPPTVTAQQLQIDIVFPRNETYKDRGVFPMVFAIQNITALSRGNFQLIWDFMWFRDSGHTPTGMVLAKGRFNLSEIAASDSAATGTTFLIAPTNATKWIRDVQDTWNARYMVQYYLVDWDRTGRCHEDARVAKASFALVFNVMTAHWARYWGLEGSLKDVDIPECPHFSKRLEVGQNATHPECYPLHELEGAQGNQCAVKSDQVAASSILSHASSLAAPTSTSTTAVPTSTSSARVGPGQTVQTALAAACVLCGLAF